MHQRVFRSCYAFIWSCLFISSRLIYSFKLSLLVSDYFIPLWNALLPFHLTANARWNSKNVTHFSVVFAGFTPLLHTFLRTAVHFFTGSIWIPGAKRVIPFQGWLQPEKQFFRHRGTPAPLTVATPLKGAGVVCEEVAKALSHLTKWLEHMLSD